mgnify:CR=1 FL=1
MGSNKNKYNNFSGIYSDFPIITVPDIILTNINKLAFNKIFNRFLIGMDDVEVLASSDIVGLNYSRVDSGRIFNS